MTCTRNYVLRTMPLLACKIDLNNWKSELSRGCSNDVRRSIKSPPAVLPNHPLTRRRQFESDNIRRSRRRIRHRDVRDANVNILRSWINERLKWGSARCILYTGIVDIQDGVAPCDILDILSMLVSDLFKRGTLIWIYQYLP